MTYPVRDPITQNFGDGATAGIVPNSNPNSGMAYFVYLYGNYQPDGHTGVDFGCPVGTEVSAVADGVVLHSGWLGGGYTDNPWWIMPSFAGNCIVIDHGSFIGIYGHLSRNIVPKGARVHEGDGIALSGDSGAAVGGHLHFEVLPDGYDLHARFYGRVNPLPYLGSASLGPAGNITEIEEDMTPEDRRMLKAVYDAIFNGGTSMPEGKPLKDLIHDNFSTVKASLGRVEANTKKDA
jgi:murein DD-endopeptidase MepM/ murein hydrolase activator NlpD